MSEYQYYEFVALDGPVSGEGLEYAESVSSRAEVSRSRWRNEYNYGNFRGSVEKMMQFYDAHAYVANWGSFRFALALPKDCFDADVVKPYLHDYSLALDESDDRYILTWTRDDEGGGEWIDGAGTLDRLIPIRDELLRGDFRSLYLGWLAGQSPWLWDEDAEESGDEYEPPVPPGLGLLTSAQAALADELYVDTDYLAAASEAGAEDFDNSSALRELLDQMTIEDARQCLLRVALGDGARVSAQLNWQATRLSQAAESSPRKLRELSLSAERHCAERERREAKERERKKREREKKRRADLEAMLARADEVWEEVDALAEQKSGSAYDKASQQVHDLAEAYALQGRASEFQKKLEAARTRFVRRPALLGRLGDL